MFAKYYENPTMLSRVTAKNVWMFFETQCININDSWRPKHQWLVEWNSEHQTELTVRRTSALPHRNIINRNIWTIRLSSNCFKYNHIAVTWLCYRQLSESVSPLVSMHLLPSPQWNDTTTGISDAHLTGMWQMIQYLNWYNHNFRMVSK